MATAGSHHHAFISYSHRDARRVGRLHRRIVRFGLPPWRRATLNIFRDKEDLEAGHELVDALHAELASADHFLLVVSPHSATSTYVNEEIKRWLAGNGTNGLIPVIVDWEGHRNLGEFDWSGPYLPEAVRGLLSDPLAVDARRRRSWRERRRYRNADREAMASLVGRIDPARSKEQLVGDERRRIRAVRLVAGIVAAVFAIGGAASLLALQRSSTAAEQSDAARTSVELAATARAEQDADLQLLLAAEAYRIAPTAEASATLSSLLGEGPGVIGFLRVHEAPVLTTSASADGGLLRSISSDGTIATWDLEHGTVSRHALGANLAAAAVGGDHVALATVDHVELRSLEEPDRVVWSTDAAATSVDVTAAGLLAIGTEDGRVLVGTGLAEGTYEVATHHGRVNDVKLSVDSRLLASVGDDGSARLADLVTLETTTLSPEPARAGKSLTAVAFSPDGRLLVTAGTDQSVATWDIETLRQTSTVLDRELSAVLDLAFSADGTLLVAGDIDGAVVAWNFNDGAVVDWPTQAHDGPVFQVAPIPALSLLVSAGADGVIAVWDPVGRNALARSLDGHFDVDVDRAGGTFVVVSQAGLNALTDDGRQRWRWYSPGTIITAVTVAGDATVAGTADGELVWIGLADGEERGRTSAAHPGRVEDLVVDPGSGRVFAVSNEGRVTAWAGPGELLWSAEVDDLAWGRVTLAPDGDVFVSTGTEPFMALYDGETGEAVAPSFDAEPFVTALAVSTEGDGEVTAEAEPGAIVIVTRFALDEPIEFAGPDGAVLNGLALAPSGQLLAGSTALTGELGVWDVEAGHALMPFRSVHEPYFPTRLVFVDDHRLLSAGPSSVLDWRLDPAAWAELACQRAGRAATDQEAADFGLDVEATARCTDDGAERIAEWTQAAVPRASLPDSITVSQWIDDVDLQAAITGIRAIRDGYFDEALLLPKAEVPAACRRLAEDERLDAALGAFARSPDQATAEIGTRLATAVRDIGLACAGSDLDAMDSHFWAANEAFVDLAFRLNEFPTVDLAELGFVDS